MCSASAPLIEAFFWGCLLSFLGSIPPGVINLRVWHLSLMGRRLDALHIIIGATSMEVIYAVVALQANRIAYEASVIHPYLYFFVALWMMFFAYRSYTAPQEDVSSERRRFLSPIREGYLIGAVNLLPIPFWIAVTLHLQEQGLLYLTGYDRWVSYLIGIGGGTFLSLVMIIGLSSRLPRLRPASSGHRYLIASLYAGVGVYFLYRGMRLLRFLSDS